MENAGKLARQAAEFEEQHQWGDAARLHRQAAHAYRAIEDYGFDPVATLTLSSLINKHARWAEYCERESERSNTDTIDSDRQSLATDVPASPTGAGSPQTEALRADDGVRQRHDTEEQDFEDFWQYMQNWLANPTAFTRPVKPPGSHGAGTASGDYQAAANRSVMESFYLVGANPDQSASVYASVAGSPKGMSPLPALAEDDEEPDIQPDTRSSPVANPAHVLEMNKALLAENQKLREIVAALQDRIASLESAAQENNMLKSSILNFREEFHKHANAVSLPRIHEQSPM
ncbi:hypothetical protein FBU59_004990, partial [Linderina macrospora]